ncbi:ABC transporter substrate-binding protein [Shewanella sp. 10N.7]|uniref:ABC transporter substrate-binding protein n=1 Tax=Shewanella sp. 10N.7 TaxID=2885093 RepID=UPI001E566B29|nr:ABC transporter substrate-binding protein [Shewanella sp. 10N.7]MCC4831550.1 ABC transporter substrate-binding protein [Shewanella sp. 10N.7]
MRVIRERWNPLALLCLLSFLVTACGELNVPSGIVYCSEGNPETFNPQLITSGTTIDASSNQLYNRLIDYNDDSSDYSAALATDWAVSDDGLQYRFTLRQDVQFHYNSLFSPSRNFNADDVIFSFARIINTEHPYHLVSRTGYPFFQSIDFASLVSKIEKINDYEVVFHLANKDASFLSNLATDFAVILSAEYAAQQLAAGTPENIDYFAIGTGPFYLAEYAKNEYIRFKRNQYYWGEQAKIDLLVFDITRKSEARLAKIITRDCQVSALPKANELAVINKHKHLELRTKPGLNVAFWAFNTQKPPLDDVRVRHALAHAVDKQNILNVVYHDTAVAASGMLPPASWAYTETEYAKHYDPEEAKRLLKAAGVTNLIFDIWAMPVVRIYNPNALKTAELIQADLANIGVTVNIVSYDWSVFTQKLISSEYDSVLIGWNADNTDPDNFFTPLLSCSALESNNNRSRWCSTELDTLLSQAKETLSKPERKRLYKQAEKIIHEQVPLVNIAHAQKLLLKNTNVSIKNVNPYGGMSFSGVELIKQEVQP